MREEEETQLNTQSTQLDDDYQKVSKSIEDLNKNLKDLDTQLSLAKSKYEKKNEEYITELNNFSEYKKNKKKK